MASALSLCMQCRGVCLGDVHEVSLTEALLSGEQRRTSLLHGASNEEACNATINRMLM